MPCQPEHRHCRSQALFAPHLARRHGFRTRVAAGHGSAHPNVRRCAVHLHSCWIVQALAQVRKSFEVRHLGLRIKRSAAASDHFWKLLAVRDGYANRYNDPPDDQAMTWKVCKHLIWVVTPFSFLLEMVHRMLQRHRRVVGLGVSLEHDWRLPRQYCPKCMHQYSILSHFAPVFAKLQFIFVETERPCPSEVRECALRGE